MGFWSSFFGTTAAHVVSDAVKESRQSTVLSNQLMDMEIELNDYLSSLGYTSPYNADWDCVGNGNIEVERRKMEKIRKYAKMYVELGGDPDDFWDYNDIEMYVDELRNN